MYKFKLIAAFVALLFAHSAKGQIDTIFWFAAPEIAASTGDSPVGFRLLSYDQPSTVTVSQPANPGFVPIVVTLPASSVQTIDLTPFLSATESPAANTVSNNGFRIAATANISAFYALDAAASREHFSLKGQNGLGMNYYLPFQKFWAVGTTTPVSYSGFEIVATENNTTVLITPRTAITGHAANVSFSVTLNAGQTYSARDMNAPAASSLAGSIVSSNKRVAVTVFEGALSNAGCLSPIGDQVTPTNALGKEYIVRRGSNNGRLYILASQNNSTLTVTGTSGTANTLINFGETYEYIVTDSVVHVRSTQPVYVWQVTETGCRLSAAQLPPILCAGQYENAFTRTDTDTLQLILYTRTGFEGLFTLNGSPTLVPASAFANVPGTSGAYKAAKITLSVADVPAGSYNRVSNSGDIFGMAVLGGSSANGSHFAAFSSFTSSSFVNAGADDTTCANVAFPLNGFIGGGSITGTWSTNGYGSFGSPVTSLNNTYVPSPLDTLVSPIRIVLTSTGSCPVARDTLMLEVSPAPIVNANADQTVCANNALVQLNGLVSGGATTGQWSTLGSGTFSPSASTLNAQYSPSQADKNAGQVRLVLTSTNSGSCLPETDTMIVFITPAPVVNAGSNITVCYNNPMVSLNGSVTGTSTTGKWLTEGNGVFTPNNLVLNASYSPSSNDLNGGQVGLILESTNNGNCLAVRDSLLVTFSAPPTVNAGENMLVCTNDPQVQLAGIVGGAATQGIWSGGAGSYSPGNTSLNAVYTPTASEIASGQIVLTLTTTDNGSCNSVNDNVQITFVAPPFANFNFNNACLNENSSFTDFSLPGFGTLVSWDYSFGDGQSESTQNPNHIYGAAGTYDVTLVAATNVGCSDTVVKTVTVYELPTANFTYSASCDENNIVIQFTDQSTSTDDIASWTYDFGGQGGSASQNPSQLFIGYGYFDITQIVETENGCQDTEIKQIYIPPYPVAGFSYNTSNGMNIGAVFNFIDTSDFASTYSWDFGDGNSSTEANPSNTYFANGNYVVTQTVTGALGCVSSASVTIVINTVTDQINTLIPNAISPNGDNKNDVWKLDFINLLYPEAQVNIYNQWGQEIFSSTGYDVPWDAYYQGVLVPEGTYFYIIDLNANTDQDIYKGAILVLTKE
jgi:gliding motility-associated-like protein